MEIRNKEGKTVPLDDVYAAEIKEYLDLLDETFPALSLSERSAVQERILTESQGRMIEDIVLLCHKAPNEMRSHYLWYDLKGIGHMPNKLFEEVCAEAEISKMSIPGQECFVCELALITRQVFKRRHFVLILDSF